MFKCYHLIKISFKLKNYLIVLVAFIKVYSKITFVKKFIFKLKIINTKRTTLKNKEIRNVYVTYLTSEYIFIQQFC